MKTYTFVIGSRDDFESLTELMEYASEHLGSGDKDYSIQTFKVEKGCSPETVQLVAYGLAFQDYLTIDETYSFYIEGTFDDGKEQERSEQQLHDIWDI